MNMKENDLDIKPHNPGGGEIITKLIIGLIIGAFIALIIFLILLMIGNMVQQAVANKAGEGAVNPLLPLIFIIIAFIASFLGNISISGLNNLLFSDKYYDFGKIFSLILINNLILFFLFIAIYVIYYNNTDNLFFVLAFHILFSVFISISSTEFVTNPNYAPLHLLGTSTGFAFCILSYMVLRKIINLDGDNSVVILLVTPPIFAFSLIPFLHSIWEKVYYSFYEMGNNFLYVPSLSEVMVDSQDVEEANIDENNE